MVRETRLGRLGSTRQSSPALAGFVPFRLPPPFLPAESRTAEGCPSAQELQNGGSATENANIRRCTQKASTGPLGFILGQALTVEELQQIRKVRLWDCTVGPE